MFQNQINGKENTLCKHVQTAKEITKIMSQEWMATLQKIGNKEATQN